MSGNFSLMEASFEFLNVSINSSEQAVPEFGHKHLEWSVNPKIWFLFLNQMDKYQCHTTS
jgi:hypothetical protein